MNSDFEIKQENVAAGIAGAFLFSLAGAVVYFVLDYLGFVSFISGFVGVICAAKGYKLFAKGESVKGMVISIIFAALAIVIGWYFSWGYAFYDAYSTWYAAGEVDYQVSFGEVMSNLPWILTDPEVSILGSALSSLGLGLLFAIGGGIGYAVNKIKILKAMKAREERAQSIPYSGNQDYNYTMINDKKDDNNNDRNN